MNEEPREQIRQRFSALNMAVVCDVFDEFEWPVTALDNGVKRRTFDRVRMAGWAYPIEGQFMPVKGADRLKLEVVDALPAGSVTARGGTNARGVCLFGDLIAATMAKRRCHGAVVDGGFRDVEEIYATGFPVFARYVSPVQSVGRWRVTRHAELILVRGLFGELVPVSIDDFVLVIRTALWSSLASESSRCCFAPKRSCGARGRRASLASRG